MSRLGEHRLCPNPADRWLQSSPVKTVYIRDYDTTTKKHKWIPVGFICAGCGVFRTTAVFPPGLLKSEYADRPGTEYGERQGTFSDQVARTGPVNAPLLDDAAAAEAGVTEAMEATGHSETPFTVASDADIAVPGSLQLVGNLAPVPVDWTGVYDYGGPAQPFEYPPSITPDPLSKTALGKTSEALDESIMPPRSTNVAPDETIHTNDEPAARRSRPGRRICRVSIDMVARLFSLDTDQVKGMIDRGDVPTTRDRWRHYHISPSWYRQQCLNAGKMPELEV
jgi:hypothetical protein